jgi:RNA polymerase sigma factor (sigma-70 family)
VKLRLEIADALIAEHMDWAEKLARSFARKLPPSFDADDLVQLGMIGLMKAADRYDSAKNNSFRGFASSYVLGECRMGVRRRHWREATAEPLDANGVAAVIQTRSEAAHEEARESQRAAWRERRRRDLIRAKLHRLDAHGQRIARLVLIEGSSIAEAVQETGIGEAQLKRDLRKVADTLRGRDKRLNQTEAALLRAICELRGRVVTQQNLAAIVGKSQPVVSRLLAGLRGAGRIIAKPLVKKGAVIAGTAFVENRLDRKTNSVKQFQQELLARANALEKTASDYGVRVIEMEAKLAHFDAMLAVVEEVAGHLYAKQDYERVRELAQAALKALRGE